MPKLAEKAFTDTVLRNLKSPTVRTDHFDAVQRGLGIRVSPSGSKTWFVMRRVNGKMKRLSLGRYPEISLSDARKKAADMFENIANGRAPIRKAVPTFEATMSEWFRREQNEKRGAAEKLRALTLDALPAFGAIPINSITRADVRALLDQIIDRGAPVHANRVLAYLRRMFSWAVERDMISSSPVSGIKAPSVETSRDRTLIEGELKAVWQATFDVAAPFDAFFQILILTGQRRNEVAGARWEEFNLERREWTIPSERAKNGSAHTVHLSSPSVDILSAVRRYENIPYVFTTTLKTPISGFSKAKAIIDEKSGVTGWTIHDLRRTFATIATGELGVDPVVMDKILNHRSGVVKGVAAVYQRHAYLEQRKAAMHVWSEYILTLTSGVEELR